MNSRIVLGMLIVAVTAFSVDAQNRGGRGGRGFGGGMDGQIVSDVLVLDNAAAEKVNAKMEDIREDIRSTFQGGRGGGGDFQQIREEISKKILSGLSEVLSAEDVKTIEPFLAGFRARPIAQVRAIRQIDLNDNQRASIKTETVALYEDIKEITPERAGPGQRGGSQRGGGEGQRGGGRAQGGLNEEARAKMQELRDAYTEKVFNVLDDNQVAAWDNKIKEVEHEIEEANSARRERGGGRGQGGERGGRGNRGARN